MKPRVCELCNEEAYLYCASDSAFLCYACDSNVHRANFLVARHVRHPICSKCKQFAGIAISGAGIPNLRQICRSCSQDVVSSGEPDSLSSSACVSSTESCATAPKKVCRNRDGCEGQKMGSSSSVTEASGDGGEKSWIEGKREEERKTRQGAAGSRRPTTMDAKAEAVFGSWSRRLGVKGKKLASSAAKAMGKVKVLLPFRMALATSFWFALRFCGDTSMPTCQNLRRLEEMSGVPAKLILAAEAKLARVLRQRRAARRELEEGWAECSV